MKIAVIVALYAYNTMGRIAEKKFPEGMRTLWHYDDRGQLAELVHEDERGILDRYRYEYDLMGNKTAVTKERRGLREESGRYVNGYDALSRLVSVSRDGNALRGYAYDAFGNRSGMADYGKGRNTSYSYDALNRLISAGEGSLDAMAQGDTVHTDYSYDNRGNMIREETEGKLIHGYEYGAMNRLAKAWDDKGQEALYRYNGLGQRTGKTVNGRDEDYLLDLTKPYHNLLGISGEGNEQCFYFDWNVAAMEETGKGTTGPGRRALAGLHYYMQDELGSPLRVSGFGAEAGALSGRSSYLSYGYDEYGNDLGRELKGAGIPNPYDGQGGGQPFGYTGYRYDGISGTYFAQAREYQVGNGRFTAEDLVKGNGVVPATLNRYGYCFNSPFDFVDNNGKNPFIVFLIIGGVALLSGCSSQEIEMIEPVIEPQPPTPTPGPAPSPGPAPTPTAVPNMNTSSHTVENLEDYDVANRTELVEFMTKVEPFRATIYKATENEDYYTIGNGHYCDDPSGADAKYLQPGYVMSKDEAKKLLIQDLQDHIPTDILKEVYNSGNTLYDYQIDVLVSIRFNNRMLTVKDSPKFTTYLKGGNYNEKDTLSEILSYAIQGDTVLRGLVKRRIAEAMIFSGYGYPEINGDSFYDDKVLMQKLYEYASNLGEERAKYCVD